MTACVRDPRTLTVSASWPERPCEASTNVGYWLLSRLWSMSIEREKPPTNLRMMCRAALNAGRVVFVNSRWSQEKCSRRGGLSFMPLIRSECKGVHTCSVTCSDRSGTVGLILLQVAEIRTVGVTHYVQQGHNRMIFVNRS